MAGRTMLDKIWTRHVVATGPGGRALLYVDRHLVHEGSFGGDGSKASIEVVRPDRTREVAR